MSYHSRLAYDIWERENYYADDDSFPSWEEAEDPASAPPLTRRIPRLSPLKIKI